MFDDEKDQKTSGRMFDEDRDREKPVVHKRMFGEDEAAHKMTPKKQRTIAIIVAIVAVIIVVVWMVLSAKWRIEALQHWL